MTLAKPPTTGLIKHYICFYIKKVKLPNTAVIFSSDIQLSKLVIVPGVALTNQPSLLFLGMQTTTSSGTYHGNELTSGTRSKRNLLAQNIQTLKLCERVILILLFTVFIQVEKVKYCQKSASFFFQI